MKSKDLYTEIIFQIISGQELIIGPVAIDQASKVSSLEIDWKEKKVTIKGDEKSAIDELIESYKELFGQISVEVCREAASKIIAGLSRDEIPDLLR